MAFPLGLLVPACLSFALSLLAAGILVEAQLPGSLSVQNIRILTPIFGYVCVGNRVSFPEVAQLPVSLPYAVRALPGVPELVNPAATFEPDFNPEEVFQFFRYDGHALGPPLVGYGDVYQVKNSVSGQCWTSGPLGSTLKQVDCITKISTLGAVATRRQLFTLNLVEDNLSCGGLDGVYQIQSVYDFTTPTLGGEPFVQLALTPDAVGGPSSHLRWLEPDRPAFVFITTRSLQYLLDVQTPFVP